MGGDEIGVWSGGAFHLSAFGYVRRRDDEVTWHRGDRYVQIADYNTESDLQVLNRVLRGYEQGFIALTCPELQVLQEACAGTVYLTEQSVRAGSRRLNEALTDIGAPTRIAAAKLMAVRDWLESELP